MVFGLGKKKQDSKAIDVKKELKNNEKDQEVDIRDKLDKGYVQAKVVLEILGAPKEHIENTLVGYVEKAKGEKGIIFVDAEFSETEEQEKMFSKFVEVEFLFKNIETLIGFCFDYMPSSIEVIEPALMAR